VSQVVVLSAATWPVWVLLGGLFLACVVALLRLLTRDR
jgi:hypothetical protein